MLKWYEPTDEQKAIWEAWKADPTHAAIKAVADKFFPWIRYRIKETGQSCFVNSFQEDGTMTVRVTILPEAITPATFNNLDLSVFGIKPESLEPIEE
jgi:hypothetical protein